MLSIHGQVQDILEKGQVEFFYLIECNQNIFRIPDGSYVRYITNYPTKLDEYYHYPYFISVEPPKASAVTDRAAFKLVFSDDTLNLKTWLSSNEQSGLEFTVRVGFVDNSGGSPYPLYTSDYTVMTYKGYLDSYSFEADFANSKASVSLECSGPLGDLDRTKPFMCTKENQRRLYPDDSAFDLIFVGSKAIVSVWGRRGKK